MKHLMNNATEGLAEPWVAYKEGVVYYMPKNANIFKPQTQVWYVDGSYKEFDIIGLLERGNQCGDYEWQATNMISDINSVEKIIVGTNVTEIDEFALSCYGYNDEHMFSSLKEVVIPDTITEIKYCTFNNCNITDIILPSTILSINDLAFAYCSSLTSVTIPDSVTSIGGGAFNNCSSLTSVTIGNSVTSIGLGVFGSCTNLTSVSYNGTTTQWNTITKGDNWKREVPSTCIVHCTDGDIPISEA